MHQIKVLQHASENVTDKKTYPDNKSEFQLPWLFRISEMQIKDIFPPLICSLWHVRTCLLFSQTKLCWNRLSLFKSFENIRQGHCSKRCFWWKSVKGGWPNEPYEPRGVFSGAPSQGEGTASCVQFVFPLFFNSYAAVAPCDARIWSILGLEGSRAGGERAQQRMCSMGCVMSWSGAGVSTVANVVQPSQRCLSANGVHEYAQRGGWRYTCIRLARWNNMPVAQTNITFGLEVNWWADN